MENFKTVEKLTEELFKEKGSKFIGFVFPINSEDEFKQQLAKIKSDHPVCNHHCYAFRLGINGEHFRYSDDGEPNNSAGKPIYGQLLSSEITNVGAVVARYFGGTKLGVGGLISAYKEATKLAIESNTIVISELKQSFEIKYTYDQTSMVNQLFSKHNIEVGTTAFDINCKAQIHCKLSQKDMFYQDCVENQIEIKIV